MIHFQGAELLAFAMITWKLAARSIGYISVFMSIFWCSPDTVSAQNYSESFQNQGQPWPDFSPQPAYNPPTGGYSAPYGYNGRTVYSSALQTQQFNNPLGTGIISSRVQTPVLPEGLVIPFQLDCSIDVDKAEAGDFVQGHITQNISAGGAAYLPGSSLVSGTIDKESTEGHSKHGGKLGVNFVQVRLPNGTLIPMKAHLVGRIANYTYRGTTSATSNMLSTAWRSGVGSELSWGTGTTFSSLAGGSHVGPGGGAYAGALMGGATGLLESIFLRRGHDIFLHPGTRMELQLDAPLQLPGILINNRRQYLPGSGPNTGIF